MYGHCNWEKNVCYFQKFILLTCSWCYYDLFDFHAISDVDPCITLQQPRGGLNIEM